MFQLKRRTASELYHTELRWLLDFGERVDVRGRQTVELLNFCTEIEEPWHHCILVPSRHWNPWIAMSEALWILAGRDDVAALKPYNSHIGDYSDNGITLYGAYGKRLYGQIDDLIARIQRDPSDRRAVLQIWDNSGIPVIAPIRTIDPAHKGWIVKTHENNTGGYHEDLTVESKDSPCNNMIYFKLRNNQLHMTVLCRSNDLHFGLFAVNIPTFGILQEYIAARLGVDMGMQTHISNSLHIYEDDPRALAITDRMTIHEIEHLPTYPNHSLAFGYHELSQIKSHEEFAKLCSFVLDQDGFLPSDMPLFLLFAAHFLAQYRRKKINPDLKSIFPEFQDWQLAAEIFAEKVWKQDVARA